MAGRRRAVAAARRHRHLWERAERYRVRRGRRKRGVWVAWRRLRRGAATAPTVNVRVQARAVAARAPLGAAVAAGGEVGGGAAGGGGEAGEVGRRARAAAGRLEPRSGTCDVRKAPRVSGGGAGRGLIWRRVRAAAAAVLTLAERD